MPQPIIPSFYVPSLYLLRLISYLKPSVFLRYDEKFETLYDVISGRRLL